MSNGNMPRQRRMEQLVARNTTYSPGYFYWFLRLPGPFGLGHIGWGFKGGDGVSYHCGSLENISGWPVRGGGRYGDNWGGFWMNVVQGEDGLLREMVQLPTARQVLNLTEMSPYTYWKKTLVTDPDVGKAMTEAEKWRSGSVWGFGTTYSVWAQNCLDTAREVGLAYGVDRSGLPIRTALQTLSPAGFFDFLPAERQPLLDERVVRELERLTTTAREVDRLDAEWERVKDPYSPGYPDTALHNQNSRLFAYRKLRDMLNQHSGDPAYAEVYNRYIWGFGREQGRLEDNIRLLEER